MTALRKYQRLECGGLWRETPQDQRREVLVHFGEATLVLSDPKSGTAISHWSLPAIQRVNKGEEPPVFAPGPDASESLELSDPDMIAALGAVRHAVQAARAKPGRLRGVLLSGAAAAVVLVGVIWLPGALVRHTASVVPLAQRADIGQRALDDLTRVTGSGPGGRITKEDVQQATGGQVEVPTKPDEPAPTVAKVVPFTGMRQMIAENMLKSLHNMAQVTLTTEVDVTELVDLREHLKKRIDITYTDLIVKAVTLGLRQHPRLNASLVGNEIHLAEDVHIGFGVALEEGLIVPVITHADRLTLSEIGMRVRDLATRARLNTLHIDEVTGSTFTISNLGAYGIDGFTPIINPPQVAILGVGRIIEKPGIYRGEIARRSMLVLSLTFDHRLVDGAPAAAFLHKLAEILAHPYYLKDG